MPSPPLTPPPPGPGRGPAWLSRSLVISTALWLILLGASLGALFDLARAWARIRTQGFEALGFTRSSFLFLERAADHGALRGATTALWFLILALLASAYAPVRVLFDPRELSELLVTRDRLFRAQVAVALAYLLAAIVLANTGAGMTRHQLYTLGVFAAFGVVALAAIGRFHRRELRANDPAAQAAAFASCAALGVIAVLGYAVNDRRPERLVSPDAVAANVLLIVGSALTFVLTRRAILASNRARAPADRGALGSRAVRIGLVLAVLPALAPLCVRAAARLFGHSGVRSGPELNVVIIAVDALRADSVDWTEPPAGARDRTPHLRELAARGVRFSSAITQATGAAPAYASILTGKYPLEHGAAALEGSLRFREVTLAEILREAGYATGAFVSSASIDLAHGFAQGYDEFGQQNILPPDAITSAGITDQAIHFIERHSRAPIHAPFHVFVHYSDPGDVYRDHAGWTWADRYTGWWRNQNSIENLVRNRNLVSDADLTWLRDLHDEEVAYTDNEIGRLLAALRRTGSFDRTLVVVVSGFGEEFLDHGNFSHGTTLHEELVHVPLLVALHDPEHAGTERLDVVETRSVFSTVLDRLGIDFAIHSRPRSLLDAPPPAATGEEAPGAYSMVWLPDASPSSGKRFEIVSLRTGRWKLIHDLTRETNLLYDVAADPRETRDVAASESELVQRLRTDLDGWLDLQRAYAARPAAPRSAQAPAALPLPPARQEDRSDG